MFAQDAAALAYRQQPLPSSAGNAYKTTMEPYIKCQNYREQETENATMCNACEDCATATIEGNLSYSYVQ